MCSDDYGEKEHTAVMRSPSGAILECREDGIVINTLNHPPRKRRWRRPHRSSLQQSFARWSWKLEDANRRSVGSWSKSAVVLFDPCSGGGTHSELSKIFVVPSPAAGLRGLLSASRRGESENSGSLAPSLG
ncbi:unnamed protein product [Cercospora beticola]|nr:unnamed protein product [Cercospora beticola]